MPDPALGLAGGESAGHGQISRDADQRYQTGRHDQGEGAGTAAPRPLLPTELLFGSSSFGSSSFGRARRLADGCRAFPLLGHVQGWLRG